MKTYNDKVRPDTLILRVCNGKGGKHRVVTLADELIPSLRQQIVLVQ